MGDRAKKSGLGYEVEKKMESNYDREEEAGTPVHIVNWLNDVLNGEHEQCAGTDWKSICTYLRDGVALCKLINKLLVKEGRGPVQFQKKVMSPFVAMTNIENFNKGCLDYGLAKEFEFQSGDLWEVRKGPFLNVINCIHSLGFVANSKKVMPCYQGEVTKYLDRD
ncbi:rac guanine nucleotide exchange factor B-like isoform X1 [Ostrea edulis]|uniref:rac guanine nucleotide exchange factor B-like isoform X1 n=1 Tax=Ostrea edulis TaxID=37623 RepID=UPI0024AFC555|nr:rac guanine nucleotide exchange factor B-like isoform X1 [Ostrea edulis]XP_055997692.1 rac guanine nucleotide exchange factor B-like isoform X1 [Ostrea edulis]